MVEKQTAQAVLDMALTTGGDFSELFMEDTESNNISMNDGSVETATYSRIKGAGIRVLKGTKCAYAYTSDTREEALMETARAAAAAIDGLKEGEIREFSVREDVYKRQPLWPAGCSPLLRRAAHRNSAKALRGLRSLHHIDSSRCEGRR